MGNPQAQYEDLIQGLCLAAGIEGWREVAASQHLRIGDELIGLVPDTESNPPTLSIYIEQGRTHLHSDGDLYARMLQANLSMKPQMPGHYGLHPQTQQAVYALKLGLDDMEGDELAVYLDSQIDLSRDAMKQLAQADR